MAQRVVVFVRGGMVAGVTGDDDVEVVIADFDVDGQDTKKRDPVDGLPVHIYREDVLVDVKRTSAHFDLADEPDTDGKHFKCNECGWEWEAGLLADGTPCTDTHCRTCSGQLCPECGSDSIKGI